jgi:dienelactone hydrolase
MIHLYPDTPHSFNTDYRPSYRKAQAEDGWKRAVAWFSSMAWRRDGGWVVSICFRDGY